MLGNVLWFKSAGPYSFPPKLAGVQNFARNFARNTIQALVSDGHKAGLHNWMVLKGWTGKKNITGWCWKEQMNSDWKKEHDRAYGLLSKMLTRNFSLEFPKPGRDSNYLKTIHLRYARSDLRKTCAAKIHLQQKSDFCFHRCSPKMHFPKKMHNVRVRKYANVGFRFSRVGRLARASPISTHA